MRLSDEDYYAILETLDLETIPDDPVVARQAIESFVDLVEILYRQPMPLPPLGGSSFNNPSSSAPQASRRNP